MASATRVVCWRNRDEWLQVYRQLYNFDNTEAQQKGVDRVAAWTSRSGGKLPLAIESTANLISAYLGSVRDVESRLMLAMALVRFVNGMVDQVQKGMFARSVQSIADEIGLPDWLVDLRHEATHASLPPMETLQCGVRVSLSWLRDEYWEAQLNMHENSTEKLCQLLNEYRDQAFSHVLSRKKKAKFKGNSKVTALANEIKNLVSLSDLWSFLPSFLSQEGLLVPSCEQLQKLGVDWPEKDDVSRSSVPCVPLEVVNMWKTLLETLDKASPEFMPSLVTYFLENLSESCDDQSNDISLVCAAWVLYWLQVVSKKKSGLVLAHSFPWLTLLQISLAKPMLHSLTFIPLILENMPVASDLKQRIEHLVSLYIKPTMLESKESTKSSEVNVEFFDLEEWMESRKKTTAKKAVSETETSSASSGVSEGWSVCQGSTQWHLIPFGDVLGTDDMLPDNLELGRNNQSQPFHGDDISEHLIVTDHCTGNDESFPGCHDEEMVPGNGSDVCMGSDSDDSSLDMLCEHGLLRDDGEKDYEHDLTKSVVEDGNDKAVFDSDISNQICIF